jgi:hypothetical protein
MDVLAEQGEYLLDLCRPDAVHQSPPNVRESRLVEFFLVDCGNSLTRWTCLQPAREFFRSPEGSERFDRVADEQAGSVVGAQMPLQIAFDGCGKSIAVDVGLHQTNCHGSPSCVIGGGAGPV